MPVPSAFAKLNLPSLRNVQVIRQSGDSILIGFDDVDSAKDYMIFPMPKDPSTIRFDSQGRMTIPNAIYRCAGDLPSAPNVVDGKGGMGVDQYNRANGGGGVVTLNGLVNSIQRLGAENTLGVVYTSPGQDRMPVYALGNTMWEPSDYGYLRNEYTIKHYVTDFNEVVSLMNQGWRYDGIQFYVPSKPDASYPVIKSLRIRGWESDDHSGLLFMRVGSQEDAQYKSSYSTNLFSILPAPAAGQALAGDQAPLMRFYVHGYDGYDHDELAVGNARYAKLRDMGRQPFNQVHWSGITQTSTFVIQALDQGCPRLGTFAAQHIAPTNGYPEWFSMAQMRSKLPTGEFFLNGQHDPANRPKAIAIAAVQAGPMANPKMDFFDGFDGDASADPLVPSKTVKPGPDANDGSGQYYKYFESSKYLAGFTRIEGEYATVGQEMGQLWARFIDTGSDVNGKFNLTVKQPTEVKADSYLHATMEVDLFSTNRRYPGFYISDKDVQLPIQDYLTKGNTIVVQTFGQDVQVQFCHNRGWQTNDQCPGVGLYTRERMNGAPHTFKYGRANVASTNEYATLDRPHKFDVYASTSAVYVYIEDKPFGCVKLPTGQFPAGPAHVTYRSVLYHEQADDPIEQSGGTALPTWDPVAHHEEWYGVNRHFDNLGFSAGQALPAWDKTVPCIDSSEMN